MSDNSLIVEKRKLRHSASWPSEHNAGVYRTGFYVPAPTCIPDYSAFLVQPHTLYIAIEIVGGSASLQRTTACSSLEYALALIDLFSLQGRRFRLAKLVCECGKCNARYIHSKQCKLSRLAIADARTLAAKRPSKQEVK